MNGYRPTKEQIINFINEFKKTEGHYPSTIEFNESINSPCSTKTIERYYGSLTKIKKEMGIEEYDLRKGNPRAIIASESMAKSLTQEKELFTFLELKLTRDGFYKYQEYNFDTRNKSDAGIKHKDGHFFVDIFWASTIQSAMNVINMKVKKIVPNTKEDVYVVCTNNNLDREKILKSIKFKKNPLPENIKFMFIDEFYKYCETLKSIV